MKESTKGSITIGLPKTDLDRDFFAAGLGCPDSVENPHLTGYGTLITAKPMFKGYDLETTYYQGVPAGQISYLPIEAKKGKVQIRGLGLSLFGERFSVLLPLDKNFRNDEKDHITSYDIIFDPSSKYVYLGTFIYDFVQGTYFPKLVDVRDEYDEAQAWINEQVGKEVILCRGDIQ